MGLQIKGSTSDPIPEGAYTARITSVAMGTSKFGETLIWKIEVCDSNFPQLQGMVASCVTSFKASPTSKLGQWLREAFEIELQPGESLNTDALLNRVLRIKIKQVPRVNQQNGQQYTISNVERWGPFNQNNPNHGKPMEARILTMPSGAPPVNNQAAWGGGGSYGVPPANNVSMPSMQQHAQANGYPQYPNTGYTPSNPGGGAPVNNTATPLRSVAAPQFPQQSNNNVGGNVGGNPVVNSNPGFGGVFPPQPQQPQAGNNVAQTFGGYGAGVPPQQQINNTGAVVPQRPAVGNKDTMDAGNGNDVGPDGKINFDF